MTVKKFIALISAAVAAVAITASAQVAVDVTSAYVFRGGTINDEVNIQPGFDTSIFGGSTTVGTWANYNTDTSDFDEIDYFFGVTIPTGDSPVSLEVGYTEYTYPNSVTSDDETGEITGALATDREPYLSIGTEVGLSLLVAYGIDGGIDKSLYLELGYEYGMDLAENLGLGLSAALGYSDPDQGESGFSHLTLGAGLDIAIPESEYSVSVGVAYVVETDDTVLEVGEDFFFTIGTTLL